MSQFPCGKFTYRAGTIDARSQFHIVRRLAPFLTGMLSVLSNFSSAEGVKNISREQAMLVVPGLVDVLSKMDDETADYVIFGLLKTVTRQESQGLGWAPVSKGDSLMYADISMPEMLTLAARSLMVNMGDFFVVLNSALKSQDQSQNPQ